MLLKKVKMNPGVLIKFRRQNEALSNKLEPFREKVWETYRREDIRRNKRSESLNINKKEQE